MKILLIAIPLSLYYFEIIPQQILFVAIVIISLNVILQYNNQFLLKKIKNSRVVKYFLSIYLVKKILKYTIVKHLIMIYISQITYTIIYVVPFFKRQSQKIYNKLF